MASNSSQINFGNELSEIKLIRRVLLEFGIFGESDMEISRALTLAKVDEFQDRMNARFEQSFSGEQENENKWLTKFLWEIYSSLR